MKAFEFVNKFGWDEFKDLYQASLYVEPFQPQSEKIIGIKKSEIKELFDAFELVESYGGLVMAKRQYSCFANACESVGVNQSPRVLALGIAINLVEQCQ